MSPATAPDVQSSQLEWIDSPQGQRVCQRIHHIFPLSPDASIRRAVRRSLKRPDIVFSDDALVLDVVRQLSSFEEN